MTGLADNRNAEDGDAVKAVSERRESAYSTEPFFLVGSERSGTTLLRLMLSHHPRIECAPEFEFLVDRLGENGVWPPIESYCDYLDANRVFLPHQLEVDRSLTYPGLVRSFVDQYARRSGKALRGATCHHAFHRLPRIWPQSRFIHLLRDGRDVARSCMGMGWAGNVVYGAQRWIDAQVSWNLLTDRVPSENVLEIRYEDLVAEPEATLDAVCRFIGTEFDPAVFDYAEASSYDRPDPSLIAQWKRKLSGEELALLEARIGPMLRARGYEDSGVAPARMTLWKRLELYLDNRFFGFRFRTERYGIGNVVMHYIARRLGWRSIERRIDLARNAIDNRHLK